MRWLVIVGLLIACGDDDGGTDAGTDATMADATADVGQDAPVDVMPDSGPDSNVDAPDVRRQLLDALGSSVWSGLQTRTEDVDLVERGYELRFEAGSLEWAEIRNPFGPNRLRTLRSFSVQGDGRTIDSIILSPAGWPPHPRNGARESWTLDISDGRSAHADAHQRQHRGRGDVCRRTLGGSDKWIDCGGARVWSVRFRVGCILRRRAFAG